jgi:flagellar motor switch protein FliN/FliY
VSQKNVDTVELSQLEPGEASKKLVTPQTLDVVKDVQLRLTAVLGQVSLTVAELFALTENSILSLDTLADEPVDLVLDNRVVARGALVIVDDNFGIQITEVITEA